MNGLGRDIDNVIDAKDAVTRLRGAGLVHITADGLVFPTRASLRMHELAA